jgi:hypothetical protein
VSVAVHNATACYKLIYEDKKTAKWEDNIKMNLKETGWEGTHWISPHHYRDKWQAVANMVGKFWVQQHAGNFSTSYNHLLLNKVSALRTDLEDGTCADLS